MGTLKRSCVKAREAIELSFGVVSGVTPGIGEVFLAGAGVLIHWF